MISAKQGEEFHLILLIERQKKAKLNVNPQNHFEGRTNLFLSKQLKQS